MFNDELVDFIWMKIGHSTTLVTWLELIFPINDFDFDTRVPAYPLHFSEFV